MSKIKSLFEVEQERRFQEKVEWVWKFKASERGWLDDDHEKVEEYAADLIAEEDEILMERIDVALDEASS